MKIDAKKLSRKNFDSVKTGDIISYDDEIWMVRDTWTTLIHNHQCLGLVRYNWMGIIYEDVKKESL
jgi:hypothetical protein